MPSVKTDDPEMIKECPRCSPLDHQIINPNDKVMRASQLMNSKSMARGPTIDITPSLASKSSRWSTMARDTLPIVRAMSRRSRDDEARGTTRVVNTPNAAAKNRTIPAANPMSRRPCTS